MPNVTIDNSTKAEVTTKANWLEAWTREWEEWRYVIDQVKICGKLRGAALAESYDQTIAKFTRAKAQEAKMVNFAKDHKDVEKVVEGLKTLEEDKKELDKVKQEVEKHLVDYDEGKEH
jgi:uncharacterized transporter YbjL